MHVVEPNTEYLRILFTGRSGSTKTRTAYSATLDQRLQPVLGLDARGQPRSIVNYRPKPKLLRIEDTPDLTEVYNWLKRGQKASDPFAVKWKLEPPYKTLVIDGFSELQRLVVRRLTGNQARGPGDIQAPTQIQHYNDILAQTLAIASDFYDLPMHVIGTSLEQERQEGENGPVVYRHQLVGQARDQLSSYPEVVGRLVHIEKVSQSVKAQLKDHLTAETESICFFRSSLRHEAKDQTHRLGHVMVDPTMTKIMDLIEAEGDDE